MLTSPHKVKKVKELPSEACPPEISSTNPFNLSPTKNNDRERCEKQLRHAQRDNKAHTFFIETNVSLQKGKKTKAQNWDEENQTFVSRIFY